MPLLPITPRFLGLPAWGCGADVGFFLPIFSMSRHDARFVAMNLWMKNEDGMIFSDGTMIGEDENEYGRNIIWNMIWKLDWNNEKWRWMGIWLIHEMKWQWYCIFNVDILWYGTIWYYMRSCYDMIQKILTCMYLYKQHIIHVHEIWKMIHFICYMWYAIHCTCAAWYDIIWYQHTITCDMISTNQQRSTTIQALTNRTTDYQNHRLWQSCV